MDTSDEIFDLMRRYHIRMFARKRQAFLAAERLQPGEKAFDTVKASGVFVNGKRIGYGGFALVFLTNQRLLVIRGKDFSLPLADIVAVSELDRGRFVCTTGEGKTWKFVHAKGIVRLNGNKPNTDRFYASLRSALGTTNPA
jgi:hypothetical protein